MVSLTPRRARNAPAMAIQSPPTTAPVASIPSFIDIAE